MLYNNVLGNNVLSNNVLRFTQTAADFLVEPFGDLCNNTNTNERRLNRSSNSVSKKDSDNLEMIDDYDFEKISDICEKQSTYDYKNNDNKYVQMVSSNNGDDIHFSYAYGNQKVYDVKGDGDYLQVVSNMNCDNFRINYACGDQNTHDVESDGRDSLQACEGNYNKLQLSGSISNQSNYDTLGTTKQAFLNVNVIT